MVMKDFLKLVWYDETQVKEENKITESFIEVFQDMDIERNMEDLISTLSFNMPVGLPIASKFQKYQYIEYWVKTDEPNVTTDYRCKFRGWIDTIHKIKSKKGESSNSYSIGCLDKLSIFERVDLLYAVEITQLKELVLQLFSLANLSLPRIQQNEPIVAAVMSEIVYELRMSGEDIILNDIDSETNLNQYLRNIRENTILYIYYDAETDKVIITTPTFLQFDYRNDSSLPVTQFDTENNLLGDFNYGDISSDINAVIYIGLGGQRGVAIDYLQAAVTQQVKPLYKYNFSTSAETTLREQARQDLLDIVKTFKIRFNIPVINDTLDLQLGQLITINDHDILDEDKYWIVRQLSYTINKDDVLITVEASASTITDFPENLVLQDFGITSPLVLEVLEKETGDFNEQ